MVENVILFLIYAVVLVGLVFLAQWVLAKMNVPMPPMLMNIVWILVMLVLLLLAWRAFSPFLSGGMYRLFPR